MFDIGDKVITIKEITMYKNSNQEPVKINSGEIFTVVYKESFDSGSVYYEMYNDKLNINIQIWDDPGIETIETCFKLAISE